MEACLACLLCPPHTGIKGVRHCAQLHLAYSLGKLACFLKEPSHSFVCFYSLNAAVLGVIWS